MIEETPEILGRGRHLVLLSRDGWEYVSRPNATGVVAVAAVTDGGEIVLVEQHRVPVGRSTLELPAGLVGDEAAATAESGLDAARRELREETGFVAARWTELGTCVSSGGVTDETVLFFGVRGLERVDPGGGVGRERIRVHLVPLAQVHDWLAPRLADGACIDAKVYAGIAMLQHERLREDQAG